MIYDITVVYAGMLVFIRAGAFLFFIPYLGGHMVPMKARIALAFLLAVFLATYAGQEVGVPANFIMMILAGVNETIAGAIMGLAARMVFYVLEMAGHYISVEVGLMVSKTLNPMVGESYTIVESVLFYFALLIIFATGLHLETIAAFAKSFSIVPPGTLIAMKPTVDILIKETSHIFLLGLQISAPFIAVIFVVNMSFAVLGKIAPNVNVFMVSFAVRTAVGLTVFFLVSGILTRVIYHKGEQVPLLILNFIGN